MYNPIATYRLQFHREFTFSEFEAICDYLQTLGVSTIYASPVFAAVPGSNHGYDGINPHAINPEIGTLEQLRQVRQRLREAGIGWLQDIVPNHMAFHPENEWLMDVLEKGRRSPFATWFDIDWAGNVGDGRLMVPFLGNTLREVIQNGELKLDYTDRLVFRYYDSTYPLSPKSYARIITGRHDSSNQALEALHHQLLLVNQIDELEAYAQEWREILLQLAGLMKDPRTERFVRQSLDRANEDPQVLQELADQQEYRLCHWAETDEKINYRRFFTVNSLICMNMQDPEVFQQYHRFIAALVEEGIFQGLRIDHVDGLYDPGQYLEQLRELVGDETYITVEKILEQGEKMEASWPIEGNTGYDFLAMVNNLFTRKASEPLFSAFYNNLANVNASIGEQIFEKKKSILHCHMAGELENLVNLFFSLDLADSKENASKESLKQVIGDFLVRCPVYRFYGNRYPLPEHEQNRVKAVLAELKGAGAAAEVDLVEKVICSNSSDVDYGGRVLKFYQRLMQFSGPLMAKGVEDTLMYTYNRFIGHNEVGDSPEAFGLTTAEFHQLMVERQQNAPMSMNATSTHDTKRGEDVRARLNVLTDLADEWRQKVGEWQQMSAAFRQSNGPDANDEYFIYQSLIGAYPMPGAHSDEFGGRLESYLEKSLREAKTHSNWTAPDLAYEEATKQFATSLLDPEKPFWTSFSVFHQKVADFGILNSLGQLLLKFTCPGVPDVYQGCEHWDLSFVDPDNRRPVNYQQHQKWLQEIGETPDLRQLWTARFDGRIKLWLTRLLFGVRKAYADLFSEGSYQPIEVEGKFKANVFAFARRHKDEWLIVAIPLHLATIADTLEEPIDWADTRLVLPMQAPQKWADLLVSGVEHKATGNTLALNDHFETLPLLLMRSVRKQRSAGVLLSVTSLPSAFGIGDLGPEAYVFADFLAASRQKYWQLLPLNPTLENQKYSPYSAVSSMAGNTLLISPEALEQAGFLRQGRSSELKLPNHDRINYEEATKIREQLFEEVWQNFKAGRFLEVDRKYRQFCKREDYWLNDYALYMVLRNFFQQKPWTQWPDNYKTRNEQALSTFADEYADAIGKEKFLQFLFYNQWINLKRYCNQRGIEILGDLPFYVSCDSSDVWANQHIFALDKQGEMEGVAGVPPDYFNEDGQLWGMPVFRWEVLKEQQYEWWIRRVRKNLEYSDLIRLDHFRAFSAYWEVPAGEQTAKGGGWKPGPGSEFFEALQNALGRLPFLAEDLGDIDEPVYQLRDKFHLPGMKVLQFAFGDDHPESLNSPHNFTSNYFVYTGTHDNNTSVGWFKTEATPEMIRNLERATGIVPNERNVHEILGRLAHASVAKTVILPMQDVIGLDQRARMNTPAETEDNWFWRLKPGEITSEVSRLLCEWTEIFNRG